MKLKRNIQENYISLLPFRNQSKFKEIKKKNFFERQAMSTKGNLNMIMTKEQRFGKISFTIKGFGYSGF